MKAMILAAGRGERMRPLTDTVPKPLLEAGGQPLIVHQVRRLGRAGCREIVINLGWRGEQLREALGGGGQWGVSIRYSEEGWPALETAGGIRRALPLLGEAPFLVVNGDVWFDFDPACLALRAGDEACLALVDNPPHNPDGDFALAESDRVRCSGTPRWTFAGVGLYRPSLFADLPEERAPLGPLLREAAARDRVGGRVFSGEWLDVGTPEALAALDRRLRRAQAAEERR